ncbi:glycosyl transferase family protein [Flavimaricola marinus]|uniref:Anthranilate phosphoribosyltransferase 2 n=1 Tax=Flavimaricola marinus TaxID=1819565 RepID=A0A238LJM9_9RHOB|nr:glycosyl transferase family protein [Flavimaricola marinus]SMY09176.1 Anthranilate phosphoribosyltransferase 2 [Flavimaricola marinus]
MTLAPYVQILGRGPGRSRSLTMDEASAAMKVILSGTAAPEAVGALLMLMRMKGETAAELAGFVQAARQDCRWTGIGPALDWPCYAAGRTRGLPWFLLSAKLVAQAGFPVVLHGWNTAQDSIADVRQGCAALGIEMTGSASATAAALGSEGITYVPLEAASPRLYGLLRLRDVLGLRSCINTVLRLLNPFDAASSVQGVFHPSYREAQADACTLLGQPNLTVIKGGGGEFERHPSKDVQAFGLRDGLPWQASFDATYPQVRRLADGQEAVADLTALWSGRIEDDFARAVILGTAALALHTLGVAEPDRLAQDLWTSRNRAQAA